MKIENNTLTEVRNIDISNNTFTIPVGVTSIGREAFAFCTSLNNITIPAGVTSIDEQAFAGCTNLNNITIPAGVTSIGTGAFLGCTSLNNITIPAGVTSIGGRVFSGCTSLNNINIPVGVTSISDWAFSSCTSLNNITIPVGITYIGRMAFYKCTSLNTIFIAAPDDAEFNRIKALLPPELQDKAYPDYKLELIAKKITTLVSDNPDDLSDAEINNQLESLLDEGTKTLARYYGGSQYSQKKMGWDSAIVNMYLKLGDIFTALAYVKENPSLNDEVMELLALELFAVDPDDFQSECTHWPDKHRAMINLFKNHYQNEHISLLLTQSVLAVINKEIPSIGQTLEHLKLDDFNSGGVKIRIDKCVPLSVIKDCANEAIRGINSEDDKKAKLVAQMNQLDQMSLTDMHALFQTQPLKDAFEANKLLGTANLLPFEYVPIPVVSQPTPTESTLPSTIMALILRSFGIFAATDNRENNSPKNPPELTP